MLTLPLTMPAHFHHAPSFADVRAELAREAAARASFYPTYVAKFRMTQADADHQLAILAAIAADLEAVIAIRTPDHMRSPQPFTWSQKRDALLRELDQRNRFYPDWIAKGRFDQAEGNRRIAALAAMLALYDDGLTWQPDPPGCDAETRRAQWRTVAAALAPETQQQLAL